MTQVYEVCTCGHLKSQHNDNKSCDLCGCERFTYVSTVEI